MKPKLVAIVSIYNSGKWIENRLNNLMESDLKSLQVWCINANSPDERDHKIPQKFPVKYIKLENRISVYEAWNHVIKESDSEYITNANTDDIVAPNCYSKLVGALEKRKDYGFAYCSWNVTSTPNQRWSEQLSIHPGGKPGHYRGDISAAGVGHFPLWRRSLHDKLGYFDTKYKALADAEWWARCYFLGGTKFLWVNENLATYLWRNGQNLWHKSITHEEWKCYHTQVQKYKAKRSA